MSTKHRHRPHNEVWNTRDRAKAYVWVSDSYRGYGTTRRFRKLHRVVAAFLRGYQLNGCTENFTLRVHWLPGRGCYKHMVYTLRFAVRDGKPVCLDLWPPTEHDENPAA